MVSFLDFPKGPERKEKLISEVHIIKYFLNNRHVEIQQCCQHEIFNKGRMAQRFHRPRVRSPAGTKKENLRS